MKIKVFDPSKNRDVLAGEIRGKVFLKKVRRNHYVYKYQGYGIQEEAFVAMHLNGVEHIRIFAPGGVVYNSKVEQWTISDNIGHGSQRFLAVKKMWKVA